MRLLTTKLTIPQISPYAIERPRLLERINESPDAGMILLIAPAGYGKTTLAGQLLETVPRPVRAWYHLDEHDADPFRFMNYLSAVLRDMLPGADANTALYESGQQADIHQALNDLCYALEHYQGPQHWLVLDNWECVNDISEIAAIPTAIVSSARGRLKLVLTSRVAPSFKVRKLEEQGRILCFDTGELAFNLPECQLAAAERFGKNINEADIETFWKETAGWCVTIGLLTDHIKTEKLSAAKSATPAANRIKVFEDYFREEFLGQLSDDLSVFLQRTSVFDLLNLECCARVFPDSDHVERCFKELSKSQIPHVVVGSDNNYRLHPLVRRILGELLASSVSHEDRHALFHAAAQYYLEKEMIAEALELMLEAADYERALDIMSSKWSDILARSNMRQVQQWLDRFPKEYHDRPSYIKTYSNMLNIVGDNLRAIEYLKDKLSIEKFGDDVESFGSLWSNYWWARMNTVAEPHYSTIAAEHSGLLKTTTGFSETMRGIFENLLGVAAYLELRMQEALEHARRSVELIEDEYAHLRILGRQNIALYRHITGESSQALKEVQELIDECRHSELNAQVPPLLLNLADICLSRGFYYDSLSAVTCCVETMRSQGSYSLQMEAYAGRFRGIALWYLGDRDEGLRLLSEARQPAAGFGRQTELAVDLLYQYYAMLDKRNVDVSLPREVLLDSHPSECFLIQLVTGAIRHLRDNDVVGLSTYATRLQEIAIDRRLRPWQVTAEFLLAKAAHLQKDQPTMIQCLTVALDIMDQIDWYSYPLADDSLTSFVIAASVRHDCKSDVAMRLLSSETAIDLTPAFRLQLEEVDLNSEERIRLVNIATKLRVRGLSACLPDTVNNGTKQEKKALEDYLAFVQEDDLPPLRIDTLGTFSILQQGRTVRFGRSSARLAMQLLLTRHPEPIHEEELIEYLWPESDPRKAKTHLRTAIKDLRRTLDPYGRPRGQTYVSFSDHHYQLQLPPGSRIDYLAFVEGMVAYSHSSSSPNRDISDQISGSREVWSLYRGPYLPMLPYESFTVELREQLQMKFLAISRTLACLLMDQGQYDEAEAIAERALSQDPFWTEGVRLRMDIAACQGKVMKALRIYRRYEEQLQQELGIEPDPEMKEFLERVVRAQHA